MGTESFADTSSQHEGGTSLSPDLTISSMPSQLMIYNAVATVLYITAFVTCATAVHPTSWRQWDYNRRAAASFFACVTMITYGVSTFFSFRAWKGLGSNAATSQVTDHA
ncbi:plasmolipin [Willisornis vidua]|uniref:Plasmolipin n=1 Tax=Willisornis vidua TaxID=1566151 RepID=A0ABQ9DPU6_9PASS|nr:plasmolipin [Willisornis vidua]